MAEVTMELRNVIDLPGFDLFDFDYQITDPLWKPVLEENILNHYYYHEIGSETIDRFTHEFRTRMKVIMPYYDQLHNLQIAGGNLALNHSIVETYTASKDNTGTQATVSETDDDAKYTDFPQTAASVTDMPTSQTVNAASGSATRTDNLAEVREYEKVVEGYTGKSYQSLIKEIADNLIEIDRRIIKELLTCFITIY